ncbi:hypothetical protein AB4374_13200 [Vibrio splendidus]
MDVKDIFLKRNAQFYYKSSNFDNDSINTILEIASKNMVDDFHLNLIDEKGLIDAGNKDSVEYNYSVRVFKTHRTVPFVSSELIDKVHAYIAIFEFSDHVVILKKSTSNIEPIAKKYLDLIPYNKIMAIYSHKDVEFQKISLRNMTVSDRAMRGKSYEAVNLKGLISTHAAGRSIPHSMRVKCNNDTQTITTTTARIIESSDREGVENVALWAYTLIERILMAKDISGFLDSFATPVQLSTVLDLKNNTPTAFMIEASFVHELLNDKEIEIRLKNKKGDLVNLKSYAHKYLMLAAEKIYDIESNDKIKGLCKDSKIKRNIKTLTFEIPSLKRIRIIERGRETTLQSYIIKKKQYSICFTNPKYMYFMGECFYDKSGVSEIDSISKMLIVKKELKQVSSEKGDVSATQKFFCPLSAFGVVEKIHCNDDYVYCDDLGDEWADHITFDMKDNCINFIHSKHGDTTNGASKFQDVVGQGIKNIGNMFSSSSEFDNKFQSGSLNNYKRDTKVTNISRMREGKLTDFKKDCDVLLANPRTIRKAVLVCTFVSKKAVIDEFEKIKKKQKVKGHIVQLLWILSSFAHATKEAGVIPQIYCKP